MVGALRAGEARAAIGPDHQGRGLQEVVDPGRHLGRGGVRVAVLVLEAAVHDLEAEVVDAVGDGVHQIPAEVRRVGAVVLHQVESGFQAVLVVAVEFDEPGLTAGIGPHPGIDRDQIAAGDPAVGHGAGGGDAVQQQGVERVGGGRTGGNVRCRRVAGEAGVHHQVVGDPVESGAGGGRVEQKVVQPGGHIRDGGVGIAVLVAELAVHDLETDVVDAVGDGVDEVLAEGLGGRTVVLHQVEAGLHPVLVVAMQFHETGIAIHVGADPGVDGAHVVGRHRSVTQAARRCQAIEDHPVQGVCGIGAAEDVGVGNARVQAGVGHHHVGHAVQARAGRRPVGVELRQPLGDLQHRRVGIAVLVDEVVALDLEAQVIEPVGHGVDQRLAAVLEVAAVVLDAVEAGFGAVLVVAVQIGPFGEPVGPDPGVHGPHFIDGEDAVAGGAHGRRGLHDDPVHAVRGRGAGRDVGGGVRAGQPGVDLDRVDHLVQPRSGSAGGPLGQHRKGAGGVGAHGKSFLEEWVWAHAAPAGRRAGKQTYECRGVCPRRASGRLQPLHALTRN